MVKGPDQNPGGSIPQDMRLDQMRDTHVIVKGIILAKPTNTGEEYPKATTRMFVKSRTRGEGDRMERARYVVPVEFTGPRAVEFSGDLEPNTPVQLQGVLRTLRYVGSDIDQIKITRSLQVTDGHLFPAVPKESRDESSVETLLAQPKVTSTAE